MYNLISRLIKHTNTAFLQHYPPPVFIFLQVDNFIAAKMQLSQIASVLACLAGFTSATIRKANEYKSGDW